MSELYKTMKWKSVRIDTETHEKLAEHVRHGRSIGTLIKQLVDNHESELSKNEK